MEYSWRLAKPTFPAMDRARANVFKIPYLPVRRMIQTCAERSDGDADRLRCKTEAGLAGVVPSWLKVERHTEHPRVKTPRGEPTGDARSEDCTFPWEVDWNDRLSGVAELYHDEDDKEASSQRQDSVHNPAR
jgi:hypothetical protein